MCLPCGGGRALKREWQSTLLSEHDKSYISSPVKGTALIQGERITLFINGVYSQTKHCWLQISFGAALKTITHHGKTLIKKIILNYFYIPSFSQGGGREEPYAWSSYHPWFFNPVKKGKLWRILIFWRYPRGNVNFCSRPMENSHLCTLRRYSGT